MTQAARSQHKGFSDLASPPIPFPVKQQCCLDHSIQVVPTPQLKPPFSIPWQPKQAAFYSSFPHVKDQLYCFYCPTQEEILKVSLKCSLSRNYFLVVLAILLPFPPIKSSQDSLLLRWLKPISGSNKCLESISDIKCRFLVNRVTSLFFPPQFKKPCQDDSQEQI